MKRTNPPRPAGKPNPGNGRPRSGKGGDADVHTDTTGRAGIKVRTVSPSGKGSEAQTDRIVSPDSSIGNPKSEDLGFFREDPEGKTLTTNNGSPVQNDADTLKAGPRGPSLLEDFHLREKITHFDHERIPERVVHARGTGAHGYFQVFEDLSELTKARFLCDPSLRTPVFLRFSTVVGSRGSTDLARDVRGFATRFYTEEGNFDLVGNNMPVFFIQDAIKFPDLIHAAKPEQDNHMPQAATAHDTFWDFISLMPESMHMIMWAMSDRAIPRSLRMMEGFGVHTFRLVNADGVSRFVKFHWKPVLGVHSVAWDEAQKISGKDPDFHRRDLWEAIEQGNHPEWELGLQVVEESREHDFDFDLLDATKLIPEEMVPVRRVGRLVLNRNVDNFHAETEQVAFHIGNVVPGIDFTDDPLLQGRLFSYLDTQLLRLGGPNFHEIPINRPIAPVHNNQREGFSRQTINRGKASYQPNSIGGGCPMTARMMSGGYVHYPERIDGASKIRAKSEKFFDHFTQARMFFISQSPAEQDHIVEALRFELGKVERPHIRERMVSLLNLVHTELAQRVAAGLGLAEIPRLERPLNQNHPADGDPGQFEPRPAREDVRPSPALSMANTVKDTIATRRVAILAADGADAESIRLVREALIAGRASPFLIAPHLGMLTGSNGEAMFIDHSLLTASSVLFDAVFVAGGAESAATLAEDRDAIEFVTDAFRHCKAIGAMGEGAELLRAIPGALQGNGDGKGGGEAASGQGVVVLESARARSRGGVERFIRDFIQAIAAHRHWERMRKNRLTPPQAGRETRGRPLTPPVSRPWRTGRKTRRGETQP
jgi:catalase